MAAYQPIDYAASISEVEHLPPVFFFDDSCPSPDLPMRDLSDPAAAERHSYKPAHVVLVTVVYPCLSLVGLAANLAFLITVFRVQHMRTITNIYLVNLAVADMWFLLSGTTFGLWKYLVTPVTSDFSLSGGPFGCFALSHLNITPFKASTLFVTLVSLERYLAICRSVYHRRINSKRRTLTLVVVVWVTANVLSGLLCPSGIQYTVTCVTWPFEDKYQGYPATIASCFTRDAMWLHAIGFAVYTVPYCVEFTVAAVVFYKIIKTLSKRRDVTQPNMVGSGSPRNDDRVNRTRNRVAVMLVITGITSFTLTTPRVVLTIYSYILFFAGLKGPLTQDQLFIIYVTVNSLLYVNSVLNPFIYAFSNSRYRDAAIEAFCKRCRSSSPSNTDHQRPSDHAALTVPNESNAPSPEEQETHL